MRTVYAGWQVNIYPLCTRTRSYISEECGDHDDFGDQVAVGLSHAVQDDGAGATNVLHVGADHLGRLGLHYALELVTTRRIDPFGSAFLPGEHFDHPYDGDSYEVASRGGAS